MKLSMIAGLLLVTVLSVGVNKKAAAQSCGPRFSVGLSFGGGYGGYAGYSGGNYCPPPPPPPPPPVYAAPVYYAPAPAYSYPVYNGYRGHNRGYYRSRGKACGPKRSYGYCR